MENKGKTTPNQPPIPRPVGFLYLYFPFVSSWLQVNYAKQTQFPKPQNHHNPFYPNDLRQYSAPRDSKKQTQTNPIYRGAAYGEAGSRRNTRYAIRNTRYEIHPLPITHES